MSTDRSRGFVEVDNAKSDKAKRLLGTSTVTDTLNAALDEVIALHRRQELVELLFADDGIGLGHPDAMLEAWR